MSLDKRVSLSEVLGRTVAGALGWTAQCRPERRHPPPALTRPGYQPCGLLDGEAALAAWNWFE